MSWFSKIIDKMAPTIPTRMGWVVIDYKPVETMVSKWNYTICMPTDNPFWYCFELGYCVKEGRELYESYEECREDAIKRIDAVILNIENRKEKLIKIKNELKE